MVSRILLAGGKGVKKVAVLTIFGFLAGSFSVLLVGQDKALYYSRNRKYAPGATEELVSFSVQEKGGSAAQIRRPGMLMLYDNAPATILVAHGFSTNSYDTLTFRPALFAGYNTLMFDFRAHGDFGHDQVCTLGKNEAYDVIGALKFIKNYPDLKDKPVILYGFSMGAIALLQAQMIEPDLFSPAAKDAPVIGGIYDCPARSSDDIIKHGLSALSFTVFGYRCELPCQEFLRNCAYSWALQPFFKALFRMFSSMDATRIATELQPFDSVDAARWVQTPSFFIICKNDEKVSVDELKEVYDTVSAYKRLWITNGRRHFDSYFYNIEKYIYKVRTFMDHVLSKRYEHKVQEKVHIDPQLLHLSMGESL